MEEVTLKIFFAALIFLSVAYIIYLYSNPSVNSSHTRVNKHGLKYQFIHKVGKYYQLRFYDDETQKWIYVYTAGIDFDWYGTPFDFQEYKKRSFSSERDNSYTINWYMSIEQLKKENEETKARVEQNNSRQDEYVKRDKERRKNEGY